MSNNKITIDLAMRKIQSPKHKFTGQYYPVVMRKGTLNTRGLAEHIFSHGSVYSLADIESIIRTLSVCIPELVSQGIGVKLEGVGTFYPSTESNSIPENEIKGANPNELVKGVHLRFLPEATVIDDLTSRTFKTKCSMRIAYKEVGTRKQKNLKYIPLDFVEAETDGDDQNP